MTTASDRPPIFRPEYECSSCRAGAGRDAGLSRRPRDPPGDDQPAQRLSGPRRRHRHEHVADGRRRRRRDRIAPRRTIRSGRAADGAGLRSDRTRIADGRPGQFRGDPLSNPARVGDDVRAAGRRRPGRGRDRPRERKCGSEGGGVAAMRRHDPHRGFPRRRGGAGSGDGATRSRRDARERRGRRP